MEHGGTHCFISPSFHFSVVCSWLHNIAYVSNIQLVTTNRFCCLSCRSSRCLPVLSPPSTPAGCGGASPPLHSSGKLESPVSGHTGGYLSSLVHRGIDEWYRIQVRDVAWNAGSQNNHDHISTDRFHFILNLKCLHISTFIQLFSTVERFYTISTLVQDIHHESISY